jgi:ABC-2 type transport system permease protein
MIFISDGDVIENYISAVSGKYYPLGYDYFTNQQFGNKDFIMNCVDYLPG